MEAVGGFRLKWRLTDRSRIVLPNLWSKALYEKRWSKYGVSASLGYSQGIPDRDYRLYVTGNSSSSFHPNYDYWSIDGATSFEYSPLGERLSLKLGLDVEYDVESVLYYTQTYYQGGGIYPTGATQDLIERETRRRQRYYDD